MIPGSRLSAGSGRGVAAPGGVLLLEPIWSSLASRSLPLLGVRSALADGMAAVVVVEVDIGDAGSLCRRGALRRRQGEGSGGGIERRAAARAAVVVRCR